VILTAESGSSNTSSVYATAGPGAGYTNPVTITFPTSVTNFSLQVGDGSGFSITYIVADNAGHSQSIGISPDAASSFSFPAAGTVVTVYATPTASPHVPGVWNYWIDDIAFDAVPEPSSMALTALGLGGLAWGARRARKA